MVQRLNYAHLLPRQCIGLRMVQAVVTKLWSGEATVGKQVGLMAKESSRFICFRP